MLAAKYEHLDFDVTGLSTSVNAMGAPVRDGRGARNQEPVLSL
jgi:hypothetical protein